MGRSRWCRKRIQTTRQKLLGVSQSIRPPPLAIVVPHQVVVPAGYHALEAALISAFSNPFLRNW